jgi:hypothetical protein
MTADSADVMAADRTMSSADASTAVTNYGALATSLVGKDTEDVTLDAGVYDHLEALMICHLWHTSDPAAGVRSFSSGDFSISMVPGESTFMTEYQRILSTFSDTASEQDDTAVQRADAEMLEMNLDQSDVPSYYSDDMGD